MGRQYNGMRLEIFFKQCEIINTMERIGGHTFEDGTSRLQSSMAKKFPNFVCKLLDGVEA